MAMRWFAKLVVGLMALSTCTGPAQAYGICKYFPYDKQWPSSAKWSQLNKTVSGRLIATIPQASVCHTLPYYNYNETSCDTLQNVWDKAQTYEPKSAEMMNPYFQNQSCDPFTPQSQPCDLGNYAVYAINVTGADDVIAGVTFASENNIRLVIRSTGHDYMGKSTGKGALALWVHNLNSIDITSDYESPSYSGPAVKVGPGVIGGEAYEAAHEYGYRLVGGSCASVAFGGGYTQGGGHSLLNSKYGMAADNVLEWEVVTVNGDHLVATPENNTDLYWALSGGGGGTYAIVLSMTAKLHEESVVGGGTLSFSNTDNDTFWQAIAHFYNMLPSLVGDTNTIDFEVATNLLYINSITIPDGNATAVEALMAPYISILDSLNITYDFESDTFDSYYDHYNEGFGPLPYGPYPATTLFSSRLVPVSSVADLDNATTLAGALQEVLDEDFFVGCHALNVSDIAHPDNAVLPAWRDTMCICIFISYWNWTIPFSDMLARKEHLVDYVLPTFEAATPGGAVYLNEVDALYKGDWKKEFYGENYDRLLSIKDKYDPDHQLWGYTAIGSDYWYLNNEGRLCPAS